MRQFVVELDFIGLTKDKVEVLFSTYKLKQEVSAKGLWTVLNSGALIGPDDKEYPACKLITPLMTLMDLHDLKWIMEKLYSIGAIVAPFEPVKVHFLKGYSERYVRKIMKMLSYNNKLLFTLVLYPFYASRLVSDLKFYRLSTKEKIYHYKILINTIEDKAERREVEALVYKILISDSTFYYKKF